MPVKSGRRCPSPAAVMTGGCGLPYGGLGTKLQFLQEQFVLLTIEVTLFNMQDFAM